MTDIREIDTPHGPGRLHTDRSRRPWGTLVLSHGAGGGVEAPDLVALARRLPTYGISVIRFEQPWRMAGKRIASAPATLDAGLSAALDNLRARTPMVLGGRSAGARSACRMAVPMSAAGVVTLAFPLRPPSNPEKSRLPELNAATVPKLVIQGTRDGFGGPEEFAGIERCRVVAVVGADHGFGFPADLSTAEHTEAVWSHVADEVAEFVSAVVTGNSR